MTSRLANLETGSVAIAALLLLSGLAWAYAHRGQISRLKHEPVEVRLAGEDYRPSEIRPTEAGPIRWPKPLVQTRGAGWVYEVFTPPEIYHNVPANTFALQPPTAVKLAPGFAFELLAVKREPYRLQLIGYYGEPGSYVAALEGAGSAETFFVRPGQRSEPHGFILKDFSVEKVAHGDGGWEMIALAVLQDERSGSEVVLDHRTRKFTETPLAVFKTEKGGSRDLRVGDAIEDASGLYRIERIQLDPPEVVVARQDADASSGELRILHPPGAVSATRPREPEVSSEVAANNSHP